MVNRRRLLAIFLAILAIAGATAAQGSTFTIFEANCTGFALSGVAPNQTLDCVGGVGAGVANPVSLKVVDQFCNSYTLIGVAPNQSLVCIGSASAPKLSSAVSRKVHAGGKFDLPLALTAPLSTKSP